MRHQARGMFTVKMVPLLPPPADGLTRYSIDKEIRGDLDAITQGEMLAGGNPRQSSAAYVAMETVIGTLHGRAGTFALAHMGTLDVSGQKMVILVVPGSGTDQLRGIAGTLTIVEQSGQHSYELDYTLPD